MGSRGESLDSGQLETAAASNTVRIDRPRWVYDRYARSAREVGIDLLGQRLVRVIEGKRIAGLIVETEAYCDSESPDLACHGDRANQGRPTERTRVMFGPAGFSYVYFTYGMHWMFNIVTGKIGQANAVLIRALEPVEGEDLMAANRNGRRRREWTNGPAKLTQAFSINGKHNGLNLCSPDSEIWIEHERSPNKTMIRKGPRVGLGQTPEPWFSIPWRNWIEGNKFVSKWRS